MKRTLLIDADVIAFQVAAKHQKATNFGDGYWLVWGNEYEACDDAVKRLEGLASVLHADQITLAFSCDNTRFRELILPDYKKNRAGKEKPFLLRPVRDYLTKNYRTYTKPALEGDDILGIMLTSDVIVPGEKVCVSIDKDMMTLPGLHYNLNQPEKGVFRVTPSEAHYWFMYQTLIGDATDGYKGCPGVGPVGAHKILGDLLPEEMWEAVVAAFKKAKLTEEDALVQARCARILHNTDYDFRKNKPILWSPK